MKLCCFSDFPSRGSVGVASVYTDMHVPTAGLFFSVVWGVAEHFLTFWHQKVLRTHRLYLPPQPRDQPFL